MLNNRQLAARIVGSCKWKYRKMIYVNLIRMDVNQWLEKVFRSIFGKFSYASR